MRAILFKLKFVYRNVSRNIFRTLALLLSVFMLSFIVLTFVTIKQALSTGYYMFENEKYQEVDILISYDTKSTNYLIDTTKLYRLNENFNAFSSVFEISSLINFDKYNQSVMVLAGDVDEFKGFFESSINCLQYNEIIITKNLANKEKLIVGDKIKLYIADTIHEFNIVDIIEDESFFKGNTVFVDRNYFVKEFAKTTLSFDMSSYGSVYLSNKVYIDVKDNIDTEKMIEHLKSDNYYPDSLVRDPRDYNELKADVELGVGVMYAVLIIFAAALLFVLVSIVSLRIKTFKKEVGIVETIGFSKAYIFICFYIEIFILSIIGLIFAFLLSDFIYTKEFAILSNNLYYKFDYKWWQILITFIVVNSFCSLTLIRGYHRYKKMETAVLTKNKKYETILKLKQYIIISVILGVLLLINHFVLSKMVSLMVYSLIEIALAVFLGVILVSLFVKLICYLFKGEKLFKMTFLRNLNINRIKHNSLKILLICLFGITLCFIVLENIEDTISNIEEKLNIDNIYISPLGVSEETVNEFKNSIGVECATIGFFEDKISTKDNEYTFLLIFSCDAAFTNELMGFEVSDKYLEKFKSNEKCVLVSNDFLLASGLKINDTLTFNLSNGQETYKIVGTCDLPFQQFAYTNDYYQENTKSRMVLLHYSDDALNVSEFKKNVALNYGKDMGILYDASGYMKDFFERAVVALDVVYAVIWIVVFCFIVSIINNTILSFKEIKTDIATLEILGISNKQIRKMIYKEIIISYLAILPSLLLMVFIVSYNFGGLSLFCGYYMNLFINYKTLIASFLIGMICFVFSYIYYFLGIKNLNLQEEVKK